jgi:hypothetical protein
VDAGGQTASGSFDETTAKTVNLEAATINTTYRGASGITFDGGIAVRVARDFGLGVTVSSFSSQRTADIAASVPHPFLYNTPRSIAGSTGGFERREIATDIQAVYALRPRGKLEMAIFGGPSVINVQQDLVADIAYQESYPYDTATFRSASAAKVRSTGVGVHVGVDFAVRVRKHVGVGWVVRYTVAPVDLQSPIGGGTTSTRGGGLQLGGGIRLFH